MFSWFRTLFRRIFHRHVWEIDYRTFEYEREYRRGPVKPRPVPRTGLPKYTIEIGFRTCATCGRVERVKRGCWVFYEYVDPLKRIELQCHEEAINDFDKRLGPCGDV